MPGRQRLRRGVGAAAALPRGAAELGLGGLRQRQRPRRAARAVAASRRCSTPGSPRSAGPAAATPGSTARSRTPSRCSATPPPLEVSARRLAGRMAACLQGSLLVRFAPPEVADAFCASRLGDGVRRDLRHARRRRPPRARRPRDPGRLTEPAPRTYARSRCVLITVGRGGRHAGARYPVGMAFRRAAAGTAAAPNQGLQVRSDAVHAAQLRAHSVDKRWSTIRPARPRPG